MSKAVVQIYITDGDIPELDTSKQDDRLIAKSISDFERYAEIHGADYYYFTDRFFKNPEVHPQNEIFRILDMDYDQILTADIDIEVNRFDMSIFQDNRRGVSGVANGKNLNSGILLWTPEGRRAVSEGLDMVKAESHVNRDQDEIMRILGFDGINWLHPIWNDWRMTEHGVFWHWKGDKKRNYHG